MFHGIIRAKQFTNSDASIFTTKKYLEKDMANAIKMQMEIFKKLDLDVKFIVKTWDENKKEEYIGRVDEWKDTTNILKDALKDLSIQFVQSDNAKMYGPSIYMMFNEKNIAKFQINFEIVHRFDLKYINENNEEDFPIYVHLTVLGSYENLLGLLIEKYQGEFPVWIAPTQVKIILEGEEFEEYGQNIRDTLLSHKIRCEIDESPNNFQNKIYRADELKIPYIVTIGKKEYLNHSLKVRTRTEEKDEKLDEFLKEVTNCQTQY